MTKVEQLLEKAKRLSLEERRELTRRLLRSLKERRSQGKASSGPYAALLELAGTAQSNFRDVSRNKKKHLGAIYARRRK